MKAHKVFFQTAYLFFALLFSTDSNGQTGKFDFYLDGAINQSITSNFVAGGQAEATIGYRFTKQSVVHFGFRYFIQRIKKLDSLNIQTYNVLIGLKTYTLPKNLFLITSAGLGISIVSQKRDLFNTSLSAGFGYKIHLGKTTYFEPSVTYTQTFMQSQSNGYLSLHIGIALQNMVLRLKKKQNAK